MSDTQPWPCEAYGPEGLEVGAICFFSGDLHKRSCFTEDQCHAALADERQRLFDRIHQLADEGDETSVFLAKEFTDPEQLLGGSKSEP